MSGWRSVLRHHALAAGGLQARAEFARLVLAPERDLGPVIGPAFTQIGAPDHRLAVAENVRVYSVGKERGYNEAQRAGEFYRLLGALLLRRRYVACFAHMMPLFAAMGAPLVKAAGIRLVTWYTHRQVSRTLKIATAMSDRVVTAAADSFPIPTDKLRVLGHGIDADFYRPEYAELIDPLNPDDDTGGTRPRLSRTQEALIKDGSYIVQVARLMPKVRLSWLSDGSASPAAKMPTVTVSPGL